MIFLRVYTDLFLSEGPPRPDRGSGAADGRVRGSARAQDQLIVLLLLLVGCMPGDTTLSLR